MPLVDNQKKYLGKKSGTVSPTSPVTQTEAERVIAKERRRLDEFAKKVYFSFKKNFGVNSRLRSKLNPRNFFSRGSNYHAWIYWC